MKKEEVDQPVIKASGLTLALNGGGDEMDNATIPVRWFLSEELARKSPKYLVFIDLKEGEFNFSDRGKRYVEKVDKSVKFIQLHCAGKHRLIVLAIENFEEAFSYLEESGRAEYKKDVHFELIKKNGKFNDCLAATYSDFVVPEELFASEPTSKIGKFFFNYLKWPGKKLTDECATRQQVILAIPKLPFFILWQILKGVAFLLYIVYMIVAPPILFFCGYCPISLSHWWSNIKNTFYKASNATLDIRAEAWNYKYLRLYSGYKKKGYYSYGKRMFISPLMAVLGLGIIYRLVLVSNHLFEISGDRMLIFVALISMFAILINLALVTRFFESKKEKQEVGTAIFLITVFVLWIISLVFVILNGPGKNGSAIIITVAFIFISIIILALIVIYIITGYSKKRQEKIKANEENETKKEKTKQELYQEYLLLNYTKTESKVNLDNLPKTFDGNETVKKFRVSFWTLKAKICRPYQIK
ncbi:MAG: hypothetical protein WCT42_03210 [Candidatus Paceibacterota bacterium]